MLNFGVRRRAMVMRFAVLAGALAASACARNEPDAAERASAAEPQIHADMIFLGGPIYTGVDDAPTVEAVAVKNGFISALGDAGFVEEATGPDTEIIDLDGAAMYPGFTDAHAHLLGIGMRELTLNLEGVGSIEELVGVIASKTNEAESGALIYGRGWIETGWPEGRFPTRGDLDPASPENPVILIRADGHAAVVNSAALDAAGVTAATPDPQGGRIERDGNGNATGVLIDNAMDLVGGLLETPSRQRKLEAYEVGARVYAAYGWTGLHNMSVDPNDVSLMEEAASADGVLPIRVYNSLDPEGFDWLVENAPRIDPTGHIITRALKVYADGALGSRGAALSAPYSDRPDTSGLLLTTREQALPLFQRALEAGVQINMHAIGDRANKLVLDWFEAAMTAVPPAERAVAEPRWRIEHAQILHTDDIPRFAELGVIPSMQPSHAIGDLYFAPARLGDGRLDGAYAWRSLIDAGAVIAGGSDAPVERGDPLIEFYAAVARKDLQGASGDDWRPEEAVTRAEALKMFTLWPAIASFQEDDLGTIEIGKSADFTVFSNDIMTMPEAAIPETSAVMTVVAGDIIFRADDQ